MKRMISLLAVLGLLYGCGADSGDSAAPGADAAQQAESSGMQDTAGSMQETAEEAAGAVQEAATSAQQAAAGGHAGEDIYNRSCFSCHAAGVANAPKTGDAEAWAPRLAKGTEALVQSVKDGIPPGMPPMGLCMNCSDEQIAAAIDYMSR